jgi:hypothetical protein
MSTWGEYIYLFNSGSNTVAYFAVGTFVNNVVNWKVDGVWAMKVETTVGVEQENRNVIPNNFGLNQNYPNPFNPVTNISFTLPSQEFAKLVVYDLAGHEVRTLVNSSFGTGEHTVTWNGLGNDGNLMPSGVYFYRLEAGEFSETRKLVLLK